eukprot:scaffold27526_cov19-Tisochrysis_lutea.AAC.1
MEYVSDHPSTAVSHGGGARFPEEKQKSKDEEEARSNAAAGKDQANKPGDKGKKGDKKVERSG